MMLWFWLFVCPVSTRTFLPSLILNATYEMHQTSSDSPVEPSSPQTHPRRVRSLSSRSPVSEWIVGNRNQDMNRQNSGLRRESREECRWNKGDEAAVEASFRFRD